MTLAITKLLQLGDRDLVGVFAQLGYVNEPRLSAVLAANYASSLQVRAVKCLGQCLGSHHMQPSLQHMLTSIIQAAYSDVAVAVAFCEGGVLLRGSSQLYSAMTPGVAGVH